MKFNYVSTLSETNKFFLTNSVVITIITTILGLVMHPEQVSFTYIFLGFFSTYGFFAMIFSFKEYNHKTVLKNVVENQRSKYIDNNDMKSLKVFNETVEIFVKEGP